MAPAQSIEAKDLPPELLAAPTEFNTMSVNTSAAPVAPSPTLGVPAAAGNAGAVAQMVGGALQGPWLTDLERQARTMLEAGQTEVWDQLTRQFEGKLIQTALALTRGRRIEAAQRLGIGRNTITRKIQDLGLDD
jgi:two-component system nitrogen regulation response regulator GlnG